MIVFRGPDPVCPSVSGITSTSDLKPGLRLKAVKDKHNDLVQSLERYPRGLFWDGKVVPVCFQLKEITQSRQLSDWLKLLTSRMTETHTQL